VAVAEPASKEHEPGQAETTAQAGNDASEEHQPGTHRNARHRQQTRQARKLALSETPPASLFTGPASLRPEWRQGHSKNRRGAQESPPDSGEAAMSSGGTLLRVVGRIRP
jgi:hypothetical protein